MNERIDELIFQVGYTKLSYPDDNFLDGRYALTQEQLDKFAELIVRECVCLVLNGKYDEEKFRADDEFHQGHNRALDYTAEGLKLHFGVE